MILNRGGLPRDAKRWLVNLKRPACSEFLWSLSWAPIIVSKPYVSRLNWLTWKATFNERKFYLNFHKLAAWLMKISWKFAFKNAVWKLACEKGERTLPKHFHARFPPIYQPVEFCQLRLMDFLHFYRRLCSLQSYGSCLASVFLLYIFFTTFIAYISHETPTLYSSTWSLCACDESWHEVLLPNFKITLMKN